MATDKRLIDAIALISKARRMETTDNNGIPLDTFAVPVLAIEDAPTVDAVEVVHGRWMFKNNPITDPKGYFIRIVCSECNLHTGQKSNFCPQCGAKMDKE